MEAFLDFFFGEFLVTGQPLIYGAMVSIALGSITVIAVLTYFKAWGWLWKEYITSVDHKKIGIMYIIAAIVMFVRGGIDAMMMRIQTSLPGMTFLDSQHYNEIFTTHGTIMIIFMAMPFLIGLMNFAVPLQIGARDVAFPFFNNLSFWSFAFGLALFNISFIIGGSPDAGWTNYAPMAGAELNPGPAINYYLLGLQLSGIGTLGTGINFIVTILKMRAPGITMMRLPIFTWSTLITALIIVFAFPILTVALALMTLDRIFGAKLFTLAGEGMPMMWANLFWLWGHPEVYIVILPAFGIFSEVISTFARKQLFGYKAMVYAMVIIALLSFLVWVHHFFTMGAGGGVNSFFSITTMLIAVPTGVKIFNWLGTMYRGRITFETPMLWALAFIPNFVIGGGTGGMLAMAAADYQYHNTYFLVAHFHYVLIAGTVFGCFSGLIFWYPKMFGHKLNEKLGKIFFWLFMIGFNVCFLPMYFLGFAGMPRRTYTIEPEWMPLSLTATAGAFMMAAGFAVFVYSIYYSFRYAERETQGDSWGVGRTLDWATATPIPFYNFATLPEFDSKDAYVGMKDKGETTYDKSKVEEIHMPSNSGLPFFMMLGLFIASFGLVWEWFWMAIPGLIMFFIVMGIRSFDYNEGFHVSTKEIHEIEQAARGEDSK